MELKEPAVRLQQDDDSIQSDRETELAESLNNLPVISDIPVRDFPDYVQKVVEEYGDNGSKLANEYCVSVLLVKIHQNHYFTLSSRTYHVASLPHNVDFNKFRNIYPCKMSQIINIFNSIMHKIFR